MCVIDEEDCFIRGVTLIPVQSERFESWARCVGLTEARKLRDIFGELRQLGYRAIFWLAQQSAAVYERDTWALINWSVQRP